MHPTKQAGGDRDEAAYYKFASSSRPLQYNDILPTKQACGDFLF